MLRWYPSPRSVARPWPRCSTSLLSVSWADSVAIAEDVEVEDNPTVLPEAAPRHGCITRGILSLPYDKSWLRGKEEQLCHTITRGLISPSRMGMHASTSETCSPSLSRGTPAS